MSISEVEHHDAGELRERASVRFECGTGALLGTFPAGTTQFTMLAEFRGKPGDGTVLAELPGTWRLELGPAASECDIQFSLRTDAGTFDVRAALALVPDLELHMVVLRFGQRHLDLYLDGVLLHQHGTARGTTAPAESGPCVAADAFCLWEEYLSDAEIAEISGGAATVEQRRDEVKKNSRRIFESTAREIADDPHRPRLHFIPPAFWMNDPNGLIAWKGEFHVFYQHNPYGPFWGTMHWGHAVSTDLVHWEHRPIALAPSSSGPDRDGCFSGCCIEVDGIPMIFYTGVFPEVQCRAVGDASLNVWEKDAANPIIPAPPEGVPVTGFRDPWVWREGAEWRMVVGSGIKDVGGYVPLYRSTDLAQWDYVGPLCTGDVAKNGTVWECPIFFPLSENRWALMISPEPLGKVLLLVGVYTNDRFEILTETLLDLGGNFYAPQAPIDLQGRRLLLGWLWEARSDRAQWEARWAGCLSFPKVMKLGDDDRPRISFISEIDTLRRATIRQVAKQVLPEAPLAISMASGNQIELQVVCDRAREGTLQLCVLQSTDGAERTIIGYDFAAQRLFVDRSASSTSPEVQRDVRGGDHLLAPDDPLCLHVLIDHSVIEIIANNRTSLTTRVYPTKPIGGTIEIRAIGAPLVLRSLMVSEVHHG